MISCSCLVKDGFYQNEKAYTIEEFKQIEIPRVKIKESKLYRNYICTFDIETSKIKKGEEYEGFLYHWQLCINGIVIFGRTWIELAQLIYHLKERLDLTDRHKLVVYVHNLSYEFHFMYNLFYMTDVFCLDKRKVLKATLDGFIELRCSYYLSNMNLAKFIENTPNTTHYKGVGDLDYNKVYTTSSVLTPKEYGYCYNDVYGLFECIRDKLQQDSLEDIPLTSTGYVRRECRNNMRKNKDNRKQFERLKLTDKQYTILQECFRGGNTASNRYHVNTIIDNVSSYDMTSAYPYVMISEMYPVSKFTKVDINSLEDLEYYNNRYCTIGRYIFEDIEVKENVPIPYIPFSKCNSIQKDNNLFNYNGRVLHARNLEISLTNVDLDIIMEQYTFSAIYVYDFYFSRKGFLPKELRDTVIEYYELKTQLKGIEGREYEYMKSKNKLNSLYGMIVTNIKRTEIVFNGNADDIFQEGETGTLLDYYKSKNSFLTYQWGIFVTAYCRRNLQRAIDGIGLDVVYCDTDSVKYIGKHDTIFEKINSDMLEQCKKYGIINYADRDNKRYYLGIYDYEGVYDKFVTMGAKKYAYIKNNKYGCTVSGLNKKLGAQELEKRGLKFFKNGSVFKNSGRTTVKFNNTNPHYINVNNDKIFTGANVVILDTTYTLGLTNTMLDVIESLKGGV